MLCNQCHWQENEKPFKGCDFCMRLGLPEDILCSIVRNGCDDGILLECNAYRPKLSIASPNQQTPVIIENNEVERDASSDKEKYFIALSKQRLNSNPDEIYFNLQFHVCLITKKREPIFLSKNNFLEEIITIFKKIETMFYNTGIEVLHLDSDHIHLYVNTTPDYSFDEIADKIIGISEKEIVTIYPELVRKYSDIWEVGYFAETIG
jgi:REP element-mobilizing transposase RayT